MVSHHLKPDRGHVHHQLLNRKLGHVKSVLVLYAIAALFSLTAILYTIVSKFYGLVMLIIAIVIVELVFNTTGLFRVKSKPDDLNRVDDAILDKEYHKNNMYKRCEG